MIQIIKIDQGQPNYSETFSPETLDWVKTEPLSWEPSFFVNLFEVNSFISSQPELVEKYKSGDIGVMHGDPLDSKKFSIDFCTKGQN